MLTYENWDQHHGYSFNENDKSKGAAEVLKWAYQHYQKDIVYSCSFGAEGIVLTDIISKVQPTARIVFLDTDLHFEETYQLIEKIKNRYPLLEIAILKSKLTLEEQENKFSPKLWEVNPNQCCYYRKIEPLENELASVEAWISGLRREQSETRKHVNFLNKDERFNSIKVCPLIHWSWEDIWKYIKEHDLDYNSLHDQGYPSIGCSKCTFKVTNETDLRSGRWSGQKKTECGLHVKP